MAMTSTEKIMARAAGLRALPFCPGIGENLDDGDELRVDFSTGKIENLTRGISVRAEPPAPPLREIVEVGGLIDHLRKCLKERRAS